MEDRVKFILFLLGEEADSFAKRAEMYYKRRPEVISSVEEAYRAYRALAERYDHISGELHKANHTIATAFPDQVQYSMLEEDDDNLPKAFTAVDPRKIHKSTVEGLMKKKKGEKSGLKDGGKNSGDKVFLFSVVFRNYFTNGVKIQFTKNFKEFFYLFNNYF